MFVVQMLQKESYNWHIARYTVTLIYRHGTVHEIAIKNYYAFLAVKEAAWQQNYFRIESFLSKKNLIILGREYVCTSIHVVRFCLF